MSLKDAFQVQREQPAKTQQRSVEDTFAKVNPADVDPPSKLTIRLPKSLHRDLKQAALSADLSVQEYVQAAVTEKMRSTNKE